MSHLDHQARSPKSVCCAIITVSDARGEADDISGAAIRELLEREGHTVCAYAVVKDEPRQIRERLAALTADPACQAILLNGGTGIAPRDRTYEAVVSLLDQRLDGFGELFRMLSYEEIGAAAMLSRAVGGISAGRIVFCMPGSPHAVRLAMTRLILPQLGHLVYELTKP